MKTYYGFFSYAHHDASSDPGIAEAFTKQLESRVSAKLTNANFEIWRYTENLRTGYKWDKRIEDAIRNSSIFILLLTPKWIESQYCRKELGIFEESEPSIGEYVAPLVARNLDNQVKHFDEDQQKTYNKLKSRQYTKVTAIEFLAMPEPERNKLIDRIADDLEGMIERLRETVQPTKDNLSPMESKKTSIEYNAKAHNYEEVDFISTCELVVGK